MRHFIVAVILLATSAAHADTHRPRWDTGAKLAVAGATVFTIAHSTTMFTTAVGDGLCGLGESAAACSHPHTNLYIPLVGGFIPGRDDWSVGWGIASSVVQLTAAGVMVAGFAVHRWRDRDRADAAWEPWPTR